MVNGPLTPPPTTAIELLDEARRENNVEDQAIPSLQTGQDAYQRIFPTISDFASQSKFQYLIQIAEDGDLNGDGDRQVNRLLITTPLVLAYLILDNVPPARYALTRLPDNLASTPLVKSLMGLVGSAWDRKYSTIYSRTEDLLNLVTQPNFFSKNLGSVASGMIAAFVETFRQRTFVLLSKAYTSLPLSLAQTYLGLASDQLLAAIKGADWTYNASTNILIPKATNPIIHDTAKPAYSSLSTFNFIADSVAKLEL